MPLPPRDMTPELQHAGVRVALFQRISTLSKFVFPAALLLMQRELERGNDLALMLSESAWAHLMCLPEPAAVFAVAAAMPFGSCRDARRANEAVCAVGPFAMNHAPPEKMAVGLPYGTAAYGTAPYGTACLPVYPVFHVPPPVQAPSRHARRHAAPGRACSNAPPPARAAAPLSPSSWDKTRKEVAALVRICNGSIDAGDVRAVAARLEALGPALAPRVVRETGIQVLSDNLISKGSIMNAMKSILKEYEF